MFGKISKGLFVLLSAVVLGQSALAEDSYANHPMALAFVDKMVAEYNFDRDYMEASMASATRKQTILDAIARPAEKTKTWGEYRKIFVTENRTRLGREFMKTHADTLARAEREFGVPAALISAIIGVETRYGRNKGSYRVLDALATLSFDYPRRSKFFSGQLEEYFLLVKEHKFDAETVKGSYAGAMGYGQFIPSSYRHYAIDFDGDGVADIVNNPVDAIGSVANYFKSHGWRPGEMVALTATVADGHMVDVANQQLKPEQTVAQLFQHGYIPSAKINTDQAATAMHLVGDSGDEYWIGLQNFYVITRYNHSKLYAMAVYQLSNELSNEQGVE